MKQDVEVEVEVILLIVRIGTWFEGLFKFGGSLYSLYTLFEESRTRGIITVEHTETKNMQLTPP